MWVVLLKDRMPSHLTSLGDEGTVYPQKGPEHQSLGGRSRGSSSCRHFVSFNSLNNSVRQVQTLPHLTDDGRKEITCLGEQGLEPRPALTLKLSSYQTH